MTTITPISSPTNSGVSVRSVPAVSGTSSLADAARERQGGEQRHEPGDEHRDAAGDGVEGPLTVRPANAEPLLFPCDRNA